MGKTGGFLEYGRQEPHYLPRTSGSRTLRLLKFPFMEGTVHVQMARCLECGTPFCHGYGCPLANVIPELNDLACKNAGKKRWRSCLRPIHSLNSPGGFVRPFVKRPVCSPSMMMR